MAQFDRWRDPGFRLRLARGLVRAKVMNQCALVERSARRRPDEQLVGIVHRLRRVEHVLSASESIPALMGHEGMASRHYFEAFGRILVADVEFGGRSRRPPLDPPNALLSLAYTMIGTELEGVIQTSGLEPALGFLHGFRYGRKSLAQDLLEIFRQPLVDRWVLTLFNRRRLRAHHFERRDDGGVYLTKEAFRTFLHLYDEHLGNPAEEGGWRGRMLRAVRMLADGLLDNAPDIDWLGCGENA